MTISGALYSYLSNVTALTNLVSTRIYPTFAPQTPTMPYVTYQEISGPTEHHQGAAAGLVVSTFQFVVWASTQTSKEAVAEQVRIALDGYPGGTMGSTTVERVVLENRQDAIDRGDSGSQVPTYRKIIDFRIWFRESVPTFS